MKSWERWFWSAAAAVMACHWALGLMGVALTIHAALQGTYDSLGGFARIPQRPQVWPALLWMWRNTWWLTCLIVFAQPIGIWLAWSMQRGRLRRSWLTWYSSLVLGLGAVLLTFVAVEWWCSGKHPYMSAGLKVYVLAPKLIAGDAFGIVWAALPGLLMLTGRLFASRRPAAGVCPSCGYDLRATPQRCPECGREAVVSAGQ